MPSRYFVASANCGTGTTTGSVDGCKVEACKASLVPAVDGEVIVVGAGRANCCLQLAKWPRKYSVPSLTSHLHPLSGVP